MVGALVNNRIVTLDYELKTGDIVSVKINKNSIGPSEDWLKIAKSAHARHKIKSFLNKQNKDQLISLGKELIEREFVQQKVSGTVDDVFARKHFEKNMITSATDLYLEVGKGLVSAKTVATKMLGQEADKDVYLQRQMDKANRQLTTHSETGVVIEGLSTPQIKLANCCSPVPGDTITGYVSKHSGIVIHADFCPNIKTLEDNRMIDAFWAKDIKRKYAAWIKVIGTSKTNLLSEVVTAVNATGVSIAEVNARTTSNLEIVIRLKVSVGSVNDLTALMVNLRKITDIYSVERDVK
jgi:GTP pyrophosphokinase